MKTNVLRRKIQYISTSMAVLATVSSFGQTIANAQSTYIVKPGEGLYRIALNHGMSMEELKRLNGLTSNLIHPGQVLLVESESNVVQPSQPIPAETTVAPIQTQTTVAPTPAPTNGSGTYTVQKGDYLYKIARQFGMSVDQLRRINGLTSNLLFSGQVLKVSGSTVTKPAPKPTVEETTSKPTPAPVVEETTSKPAPKPSSGSTYTVQKGDYLYKIASQFGITVDQLRQWNGLKSNLIYSGQVLKVSGSTVTKPAPKPTVEETTTKPTPAPTPTSGFGGTTVNNVYYTVTAGDTYYSIAKGFGVSADALIAKNGPNLYVGKSIVIPTAVVKPMDIKQSYDGVRTVWLDAGHGGYESGTMASDRRTQEKTMNLNLDNKLTKLLQDKGYVVRRTRTNDTAVDFVTERSRRANASDADIFISLHHNAMPTPSATGIVSFYYENDEDYKPQINQTYHNNEDRVANSALLTKLIHNNLINMDHKYFPSNPARDHGVQTGTYAVLRETKLPSTLLEFGFIDTWNDFNKAKDSGYQNGIVNAVANGIDAYFNTVFSKK